MIEMIAIAVAVNIVMSIVKNIYLSKVRGSKLSHIEQSLPAPVDDSNADLLEIAEAIPAVIEEVAADVHATPEIDAIAAPEVEKISSVAIAYNGVVYSLPRPARHHDVIKMMYYRHKLPPEAMRRQGFITTSGRFVSRAEAVPIATAANQLIRKTGPSGTLFSEDLW